MALSRRILFVFDDAIAITKSGIPEAVLISKAKFDGLLETLEILYACVSKTI